MNDRRPDYELGVGEVWWILKPRWPWIVGAAAIMGVGALVLSLLSRPIWEASATVLPGSVSPPGQAAQLLEPVARSVERLQARQLGDVALRQSGLSAAENDPDANLFRRSLQAQAPNSDSIHVAVRARSAQMASRLLNTVIAGFASAQDALLAPSLTRLRQDLADTQANLARGLLERDKLERLRDSERGPNTSNRFSESVQLGLLIASKTAEIQTLAQRKLLLEEALSPAKTRSVTVIDAVRGGSGPVSPRPARAAILGGLAGLLIGFFGVLLFELLRGDPVRSESGIPAPHLPGRGAGSGSDDRAVKTERGI